MNIKTNDIYVNIDAKRIVLKPLENLNEFQQHEANYNLKFMTAELKKYDKYGENGCNWQFDTQINLECGINEYVIKNLKDTLTRELCDEYPQEMEYLIVGDATFDISFTIEQ